MSLFGRLPKLCCINFWNFLTLPMIPHDSTSSSVATTCQAPSCGSSRALESERYSTGCSGKKQAENMTESRNHVCNVPETQKHVLSTSGLKLSTLQTLPRLCNQEESAIKKSALDSTFFSCFDDVNIYRHIWREVCRLAYRRYFRRL